MNIIKKILKVFIDDIVLKLKKIRIEMCEYRINKLKLKLKVEEQRYRTILKEDLAWCKKVNNKE